MQPLQSIFGRQQFLLLTGQEMSHDVREPPPPTAGDSFVTALPYMLAAGAVCAVVGRLFAKRKQASGASQGGTDGVVLANAQNALLPAENLVQELRKMEADSKPPLMSFEEIAQQIREWDDSILTDVIRAVSETDFLLKDELVTLSDKLRTEKNTFLDHPGTESFFGLVECLHDFLDLLYQAIENKKIACDFLNDDTSFQFSVSCLKAIYSLHRNGIKCPHFILDWKSMIHPIFYLVILKGQSKKAIPLIQALSEMPGLGERIGCVFFNLKNRESPASFFAELKTRLKDGFFDSNPRLRKIIQIATAL